MASFLALACPLSLAIDVRTVHPNRAVRTLQMAHNKLKADLLGRNGNEAPDPEKDQAFLDVQAALPMFYVNNIPAGSLQTDTGWNTTPASAGLAVTP